MTTTSLVALPALIADIGGTNARFALIEPDGRIGEALKFQIAEYPDFADAVTDRVLPTLAVRPRSMVLALAANLEGESAKLTHGHWTFTPRHLLTEFDLEDVVLLNDFEALALALPNLPASGLRALGDRKSGGRGPKLVVGAGTGVGVGALVPVGDAWVPVTTEGGHIDFGAAHAGDFEVWRNLPSKVSRITTETVIAGSGIENLYLAVSAVNGRDAARLSVTEIVAAARSGDDPIANEAIRLFSRHLGRFAGNMVLLYMSRGGVFIGGGVVGRLAELFDEKVFREAFCDKDPFRSMLSAIPTELITHPTPAFLGIAALVAAPTRYLVDLSGRHWRRS